MDSTRSQALPLYKDISSKVSIIDNMIGAGCPPDHYQSVLNTVIGQMRRWSTMTTSVAHNASAAQMVIIVRKALQSMTTESGYTHSPDALDVLNLYSGITKVNPSLGGPPPKTSSSSNPVRSPFYFIFVC